jgi:hypothetical protein
LLRLPFVTWPVERGPGSLFVDLELGRSPAPVHSTNTTFMRHHSSYNQLVLYKHYLCFMPTHSSCMFISMRLRPAWHLHHFCPHSVSTHTSTGNILVHTYRTREIVRGLLLHYACKIHNLRLILLLMVRVLCLTSYLHACSFCHTRK